MYGFKLHRARSIACFVAGIFSTGLLFLIFRWKPNWCMKAMYTRCSLEEADAVLLRVSDMQVWDKWLDTSKGGSCRFIGSYSLTANKQKLREHNKKLLRDNICRTVAMLHPVYKGGVGYHSPNVLSLADERKIHIVSLIK